MRRRLLLFAAAFLSLVLFSACSAFQSKPSTSTSSTTSSSIHKGLINSTLPSSIDLLDMAHTYASTPGRTALSLVICRVDRSSGLQSLTQKSAQELFSILRETATQNAQTLESLNTQFDLVDVLASEGVYVRIHANAADILSTPITPTSNRIVTFQNAFAASSSSYH